MLCNDSKCVVVVVYIVPVNVDSNIVPTGKHISVQYPKKAILGFNCWFSEQRECIQKSMSRCLQQPPGPNKSTLKWQKSI